MREQLLHMLVEAAEIEHNLEGAQADFAPAHAAASDPVMRRPSEESARTWINAPEALERLHELAPHYAEKGQG